MGRRLYRFRSAITGRFVSLLYALAHPRTTAGPICVPWPGAATSCNTPSGSGPATSPTRRSVHG